MEIKIVRKVLDVNNTIAAQNRKLFTDEKVFVLNGYPHKPGHFRYRP